MAALPLMLDGIKSNGWHAKQGNNISSSGKLYVLFNLHQPYVDQFFSWERDMAWLSQTFLASQKQFQIFLKCYNKDPSHGGLGKEGQGKDLDLSLAILQPFPGTL